MMTRRRFKYSFTLTLRHATNGSLRSPHLSHLRSLPFPCSYFSPTTNSSMTRMCLRHRAQPHASTAGKPADDVSVQSHEPTERTVILTAASSLSRMLIPGAASRFERPSSCSEGQYGHTSRSIEQWFLQMQLHYRGC
jgi:hypothetical protein